MKTIPELFDLALCFWLGHDWTDWTERNYCRQSFARKSIDPNRPGPYERIRKLEEENRQLKAKLDVLTPKEEPKVSPCFACQKTVLDEEGHFLWASVGMSIFFCFKCAPKRD